ncbi:MAG: alpha/beta fold hydrolase [Pseudomonadota bacterium]
MSDGAPTHTPILLIHGLGRGPASMLPLAWRLGRAGFSVQRPGYPSTRLGVEAAIAHMRGVVARLAPSGAMVDLVGHSLGGLIASTLLRDPRGLAIRRVVQLGSPNLGSPLASRLGGGGPVRRICGPALRDLGPHDHHPERSDAVAAIAGTIGPRGMPMYGPNDGAVSVRSAWSGAGHRTAVPVIHTLLPASARVAVLVTAFLRDGRFPEQNA